MRKKRVKREEFAIYVIYIVAIVLSFLAGHFLWRVDKEPILVEAPKASIILPVSAPIAPIAPVAVQAVCQDRTYKVVKGDSLWKIAKKEYGGRTYLYMLLAEKNELETPDLIFPEQEITIPCSLERLNVVAPAPVVNRVPSQAKPKVSAISKVMETLSVPALVHIQPIVVEPVAPAVAVATPVSEIRTMSVPTPPAPFLEPLSGLPLVPFEPTANAPTSQTHRNVPEGIILPKPFAPANILPNANRFGSGPPHPK